MKSVPMLPLSGFLSPAKRGNRRGLKAIQGVSRVGRRSQNFAGDNQGRGRLARDAVRHITLMGVHFCVAGETPTSLGTKQCFSLYEDEAAFQAYEDFSVFCDFCETSTKLKIIAGETPKSLA